MIQEGLLIKSNVIQTIVIFLLLHSFKYLHSICDVHIWFHGIHTNHHEMQCLVILLIRTSFQHQFGHVCQFLGYVNPHPFYEKRNKTGYFLSAEALICVILAVLF